MNYTKNYHLPQWIKEDRIMMEDFNAAMSSMESGMTRAEGKADTAISTANTAKQTADSAKQDVHSWKNYVVGSYTGTGSSQTFNLGFRPSFLIISGVNSHSSNDAGTPTNFFGVTAGNTLQDRVTFTSTGFTVHPLIPGNSVYPDFTAKDRLFDYIAFR